MSGASVLDRLNSFIDRENPAMARFLYRMWDDEQQAITYKELREAILSGSLSITYLLEWQQDYSRYLSECYAPLAQKAIEQAAEDLRAEYGLHLADPMKDAMDDYIRNHGGKLIREITEAQHKAINTLVRQAALSDTMTVDELARSIRPCIGLTERQSAQAKAFYDQLREQGVPARRALERQATYAAKLHRQRAATIAETEMAYAYNAGYHQTVTEQIASGELPPKTKKMWLTAADERVCPQCGAMEGETVLVSENFSCGAAYPPAHPNCHCVYRLVFPKDPAYERGPEDRFAFIRGLSEEEREHVLGGKGKRALFDAGVLEDGDIGKPLSELKARGIIVPREKVLNHSCVGDFIGHSKEYKNGRMGKGGHAEDNIRELKKRGYEYEILKTYPNGVRAGNVKDHPNKRKREQGGQYWFPEDWSREDVRTAGAYVMNKGTRIESQGGYRYEGQWRGVNITIYQDAQGGGTICPSYDQPE